MKNPLNLLNHCIHILIADDEAHLVKHWSNELENEGYTTHQAYTSQEVLSQLKKIHIVLLDYKFHDTPEGADLIKNIKIQYPAINIIVITGVITRKEKQKTIEAGATAYFVKGEFDFDDVLAWIRQITYRIWLEGILNAMQDEVLLIGRDAKILWTNETKRIAFTAPGMNPQELLGKICYNIFEIRNKRDLENPNFCLGCPNKRAMITKYPIRTEWEYEHAVRKERMWIELTSAPIQDSRGEIIAAVEVGRDVTQKKKIYEHVNKMRAQKTWKDRLDLFLEGFNILKIDRARLYLDYGDSKQFRLVDSRGMEKIEVEKLDIPNDEATSTLLHEKKVMLIQLDHNDRNLKIQKDKTLDYLWHQGSNKRLFSLEQASEWVELPLLTPDDKITDQWKVFGKISADRAKSGIRFSAYEIQLLTEYSQLASDCIQNAQKQEALEAYDSMYRAIHESEKEFFTIQNHGELLKRAVRRVCETMNTRVCAIFLWNDELKQLVRSSCYGKNNKNELLDFKEFPAETYRKNQGITGSFFKEWMKSKETNYAQFCNDIYQKRNRDYYYISQYEKMLDESLTNTIFASLGPDNNPIGIIRAANKITKNEFNESKFTDLDTEIFQTLVAQIAAAITNLNLLEQYKQIQKEKENYLLVLTHQLRAPISNIRTITENMEHPNFQTKDRIESIKRIQLDANYFEHVITNFEIGVQDPKQPKYQFKKVDLGEVIKKCINLLFYNYTITLPENINKIPVIKADEFRIEQVVINLLDNAHKYSINKELPISIQCTWDDWEINLSIINEGPYIRKNERKNIMEMGVRAPAARNIVATGTGIGLWASSIILKEHKGKIKVESKMIKGKNIAKNTFTIILPKRR